MPHSYVWHASFICVTCLIHMCDMPHSYVWCLIYILTARAREVAVFGGRKDIPKVSWCSGHNLSKVSPVIICYRNLGSQMIFEKLCHVHSGALASDVLCAISQKSDLLWFYIVIWETRWLLRNLLEECWCHRRWCIPGTISQKSALQSFYIVIWETRLLLRILTRRMLAPSPLTYTGHNFSKVSSTVFLHSNMRDETSFEKFYQENAGAIAADVSRAQFLKK